MVVNEPTEASGGVIQYDRKKVMQEGKLQRTESLNSSPMIVLTTLGRFEAEHECSDNKISLFLSENFQKYSKMKKDFAFSKRFHDRLYRTDYDHPKPNAT